MIASLRSLFDAKLVAELRHIPMPDPPPFHSVPFFEKGDCKYHSEIKPELLIVAAKNSLRDTDPECYKTFLLALCAGLRRHEIDLLEWDMLDWSENRIQLRETERLSLKTNGSAKPVYVDPEVMSELRSAMSAAKSKYVINCDRGFRTDTMRLYYRCEPVFDALIVWLRSKGITAKKPIHELRKEFGSITVDRHGIYGGCEQLRHTNIRTTAAHYVDRKSDFRAGLGAWLTPQGEESEAGNG